MGEDGARCRSLMLFLSDLLRHSDVRFWKHKLVCLFLSGTKTYGCDRLILNHILPRAELVGDYEVERKRKKMSEKDIERCPFHCETVEVPVPA